MRPVRLVLFVVMMVLSGAGCARSGEDAADSEQDGADVLMFRNAKAVVARPDVVNVQAASISAARRASDRTIEVLFTTGEEPCGILQRVDATEASDSIRISVFLGTDPASFDDGAVACPDIGVPAVTKVVLRQELGNRRVIDGATGQAVRVVR